MLHSLFYLETALHVSGNTITHHQERKQLYLQHLVFVTPLLLPAAIVEELERSSSAIVEELERSSNSSTIVADSSNGVTSSNSSTIAAGSSNAETNTRCCRYSCLRY